MTTQPCATAAGKQADIHTFKRIGASFFNNILFPFNGHRFAGRALRRKELQIAVREIALFN